MLKLMMIQAAYEQQDVNAWVYCEASLVSRLAIEVD